MLLIEFAFGRLDERYLKIGGIGIIIDDHHTDQRMAERNIPVHVFNRLLKSIPAAKRLFSSMNENQKFYIWSDHLNAGLGLRRRSDKDGRMQVAVMTVINKLYDNPDPVFKIR